MAIRITCSKCNKTLNIKDSLAGKNIRCPNCTETIAVPAGKSSTSPQPSSQTRPASPQSSTARVIPKPPAGVPPSQTPTPLMPTKPKPSTEVISKSDIARARRDNEARIPDNSVQPQTQQTTARGRIPMAARGSVICSSCGKAIPSETQMCPECGYHLKLGKSFSNLSQALRDAERGRMVKLSDGTKGTTEERALDVRRQSRKAYLILISTAIAIPLLAFVFFLYIRYRTFASAPLEFLRIQRIAEIGKDASGRSRYTPGEPLRDYHAFAPWFAGAKVEIMLSPFHIEIIDLLKESEKNNLTAAALAVAWQAPYFRPSNRVTRHGYMDHEVQSVFDFMRTMNPRETGTVYRDAWRGGKVTVNGSRAFVWRSGWHPNQKGYLGGAILDVNDIAGDEQWINLRRTQQRYIIVTGTLYFIAVKSDDEEMRGAYARALHEGRDSLPAASEEYRISHSQRQSAGWFFIPVIKVDEEGMSKLGNPLPRFIASR